jgi:hypothetical protein
MLHSIVKYRLYYIMLCFLIALFFTLHMALPVVAVSLTGPRTDDIQHNNQSFNGRSHFGNSAVFVGQGQGNTGNQGVNRGDNMDSSANGGNQVSERHTPIKTQVNNQSLTQSEGGAGNTVTFIGADQGNTGNSGINTGNNQDNAGNMGNQVNNQANVIGTQINAQGTTVNNEGSTILHQINYVNLIPSLGLTFSLRPRFQFGLTAGK